MRKLYRFLCQKVAVPVPDPDWQVLDVDSDPDPAKRVDPDPHHSFRNSPLLSLTDYRYILYLQASHLLRIKP